MENGDATSWRYACAEVVPESKVVDQFKLAPVRLFQHASEADRAVARFRRLRRLAEDHDGEGASAPDVDSVDGAIAFLSKARFSRQCLPTLSDEGKAVIEVHVRSEGLYADVTFLGPEEDGVVRCYLRRPAMPSRAIEGKLEDRDVHSFIEDALGVFYD